MFWRAVMVCILMVGGTLFVMLAAVGITRMPDVYMRLQAVAKAASLGVGGVLGAAVFGLWDLEVTVRALLAIAFVIVTTPVATQLIARAAIGSGIPLWQGSVVNEYPKRDETP